jgi:hypothetical protein
MCPVILNSTCVFYEGSTLIYTGITTNDSLQTALQKIDAKFGDAMVGYTFTNGVYQSVAGAPVGLGGNLIANTSIGGNFTLTLAGNLQATKHITTGGTSSQFVKGDGTLDSNAYQVAGNYITALTGDVIAAGPGSASASLAVVNSNPGTYGSGSLIPVVTIDTKGRVTALTTTAINVPSGILSFVGDVYGSGTTGSTTTLTLSNVNSNVYTTNSFLKFKVNAKGLVTGAAPITHVDIEGVLGYVPVPETRTITINGITRSLQSNAVFVLPGGGSVTNVSATAGTGISVSVTDPSTTPNITITNTAPDQVVSISAGTGINVTGFYPNFTVAATNTGSVTDVTASAPLASSGGATPNITISQAGASTNGYLSSTDWNTFNGKQAAGNYITALTGEATASGPGSATVTLSTPAVTSKLLTGVNITGGSIAATDSILEAFGKVQNQINGLIGGSIYKGTWDAATNTPTITSGVGTTGWYYIVSVPGTTNIDGISDWHLGDWIIFDGTAWQQVDNTDAVVSVNGYTGAVSLVSSDIPEGLTNLYYTPARARTAISLTTTGTSGAATYDNITGVLNVPNYTTDLSGYVPYTGATTNVNLGEHGITAGYVGFDLTPTGTPTGVGTMYWDPFYRTVSMIDGDGDTTLQIGQEERLLIHNNTGATLTDGQVVYVTGSTGELPSVSLADASSETTSAATLGVVTESIANGADGFVTVSGIVHGLNTLAYNEGDLLWLSETAGQFTNVKPISPAHLVLIGYVIKKAGGNGSILVKIQNTQELSESSDVLISAPEVDGQGLFLQTISGVQLWRNRTIADVLGYTPANGANYVPYTGATTDLVLGANNFSAKRVSVLKSSDGFGGFTSNYLYLGTGTSTTSVGTDGISLYSKPNIRALVVTYDIGGVNYSTTLDASSLTANREYTLPNATGTLALTSDIPSLAGYVPTTRTLTINGVTYDLSANRSWSIAAGVTSFNTRTGAITLTSTDVTTALGYTPVTDARTLTINGTTYDLTANRSWTITAPSSSRDVFDYTATAGQTTFTVSGGYVVGLLDVYVNGVKLTSSEYTATNATTFVLTVASVVGDQVQAIRYNAAVDGLSGAGTTNYIPKFTASGTIGNSAITDNGTTVSLVSRALSGTSATFTSTLTANDATINGGILLISSLAGGADLLMNRTNTSNGSSITLLTDAVEKWNIGLRSTGTTDNFFIYNSNLLANSLTISSANNAVTLAGALSGTSATFSGAINLTGTANSFQVASIFRNANRVFFGGDTGGYYFQNSGNTATVLQIADSGAATFSSSVTANGDIIASTGVGIVSGGGGYAISPSSTRGIIAINGSGDQLLTFSSQSYIYNNSSLFRMLSTSDIDFVSGGSQRMIIKNSGNVGIGTTSPKTILSINGGSGAYPTLGTNVTNSFFVGRNDGLIGTYFGYAADGNGWIQQMRNDSAVAGKLILQPVGGNVGIGTTTPTAFGGYTALTIDNTSGSFTEYRQAGSNSFRVGSNETNGGFLYTQGSTPIRFGTVDTERMRITSSGHLLIGQTTASGSTNGMYFRVGIESGFIVTNDNALQLSRYSSNGDIETFFRDGTKVGSISVTTSLTSYNVTSDYRLKQDFKSVNGLDLVNKINVYNYEWKSDKTRMDGVIAHELQEILPYAVTGLKDGKEMQSVDYSKIVPVMVQAIKELKAELDIATTRLQLLENK